MPYVGPACFDLAIEPGKDSTHANHGVKSLIPNQAENTLASMVRLNKGNFKKLYVEDKTQDWTILMSLSEINTNHSHLQQK